MPCTELQKLFATGYKNTEFDCKIRDCLYGDFEIISPVNFDCALDTLLAMILFYG